ncbi:unnamed protein product [Ranitomeya imitator]|uniref:Uncharacterized protein n=1 Tax=Ranitomeya imitator TaxID=111125 RepID=A0ABN9LCI7_9NEOB|nr:unnamed protein product [Ranitomeya imitator]
MTGLGALLTPNFGISLQASSPP